MLNITPALPLNTLLSYYAAVQAYTENILGTLPEVILLIVWNGFQSVCYLRGQQVNFLVCQKTRAKCQIHSLNRKLRDIL